MAEQSKLSSGVLVLPLKESDCLAIFVPEADKIGNNQIVLTRDTALGLWRLLGDWIWLDKL